QCCRRTAPHCEVLTAVRVRLAAAHSIADERAATLQIAAAAADEWREDAADSHSTDGEAADGIGLWVRASRATASAVHVLPRVAVVLPVVAVAVAAVIITRTNMP